MAMKYGFKVLLVKP